MGKVHSLSSGEIEMYLSPACHAFTLRFLSLYGPWPYGPMALALRPHILVSSNFGKLTRYHIFRSFSDIKL